MATFDFAGGSPAIDSATRVALDLGFTVDMGGMNLPQGSALDRGAYEAAQGGTPPSTRVTDTFTRTITSGWGTAETGGAYTSEGRADRFSVDGTTARIALETAGSSGAALLLGTRLRDSDTRFLVRTNKTPTGWGQTVYVVARHIAGVGEYMLNVRFAPGGTFVRAVRRTGSSQTLIGGQSTVPISFVAGSSYRVRTRVTGANPTTLQFKMWASGQAEPSGWHHTVTDSTASLQVAGSPGLRTWISGDTTNAPVRFTFDELTVIQP